MSSEAPKTQIIMRLTRPDDAGRGPACYRFPASVTATERSAMRPIRFALLLPLLLAAAPAALACTNLIVSPGATADGSTYVTYTCDGEFHPTLTLIEPGDHEPGAMQDITDWGGKVLGQVPYPAHTWRVVNLMNEHQVSIAETTTTGRDGAGRPRRPAPLLDPDAPGPAAGDHRPRGRRGHGAAGGGPRLPQHRRVVRHRRSPRGLDHGDDRPGARRSAARGRPLGGHPRARRHDLAPTPTAAASAPSPTTAARRACTRTWTP